MNTATLVFPHQLFAKHPAIAKERPVHLVEDPLFFGNDAQYPVCFHKQKLMLHRASMQAYAAELRANKCTVSTIPFSNTFQRALASDLDALHVADLHDFILEKRLKTYCEANSIELVIHPSPYFLTPNDFLENYTGIHRKKPFMAKFYKEQRKRMNIMLDQHGDPEGGQWSFDTDNRKKLPKDYTPPSSPAVQENQYVHEARDYVECHFSENPGSTETFRYPVTRIDAEAWLENFITERFREFGPYEDSISTQYEFINHSILTPSLNIGMLTPQQIIDAVMNYQQEIPINSKEGFIRQIIGWREFMHGIYKHRGVEIRTRNTFKYRRKIPASFYKGTTGIPPIDHLIQQLQKEAYCHHIERLMVLGNFMLLCRFDPDEVYRWFMEFFIDAYDWVMVPNVYGMSQFADGGTFTTKPYISGSNYIIKMSDWKKGEWADIWNALYWVFIADNIQLFQSNPRSSMAARTWQKFSDEKQQSYRKLANDFFDTLK